MFNCLDYRIEWVTFKTTAGLDDYIKFISTSSNYKAYESEKKDGPEKLMAFHKR